MPSSPKIPLARYRVLALSIFKLTRLRHAAVSPCAVEASPVVSFRNISCRSLRGYSRGLLGGRGGSTSSVLGQVGRSVELARTHFDAVPDLAGGGWGRLVGGERVDTGLEQAERILGVAALGDTSAKEGSVETQEDPRTALEKDGSEQEANPEENLEGRDNRHGGVVVCLDKVADGSGKTALSLRPIGGTSRSLDWLHRGQDIGASVSRNVENRVDAVGQHSQRVLRSEQPDESHGKVLDVLVRSQAHDAPRVLGSDLLASAEGLVDNYTVCEGGGDESQAVGELGHAAIVVESDVGKRVTSNAEEQNKMPREPGKLKSLRQLEQTLLQRQIGRRRGSHDEDGSCLIAVVVGDWRKQRRRCLFWRCRW